MFNSIMATVISALISSLVWRLSRGLIRLLLWALIGAGLLFVLYHEGLLNSFLK